MEHIVKATKVLSNDREVRFILRSWRLMAIDTTCKDIKVNTDKTTGKVKAISFDGLYNIGVGTQLPINYNSRIYTFRLNHIIIEDNVIYFAESERNITTRFILPALKLPQESLGLPYLYNAYLHTDLCEDDDFHEYLYLCYRYIDEEDYLALETRLKAHPNFVRIFEPTQEHTLFKFTIPSIYQNSVKLIIDGKYSKITSEFKRTILKYHKVGQASDMGAILYRDPDAVKRLEYELGVYLDDDTDIYQKMNLNNETFRTKAIPD